MLGSVYTYSGSPKFFDLILVLVTSSAPREMIEHLLARRNDRRKTPVVEMRARHPNQTLCARSLADPQMAGSC